MAQSLEIIWHGTPMPELESKIQVELAQLLTDGLATPSDLIFHNFFLGEKDDDPIVRLWGEDDDHRFHAEYLSRLPDDSIIDFDDLSPEVRDVILRATGDVDDD